MMKVEIISKESIRPSSETPPHLKTFKLSLLDQLIPAPYAPIVLFYPNYGPPTRHKALEKSVLLKQSLSETLTRFYPLAGTIKDDLTIDCDDKGAYYAVATVNRRLSEFLSNPDLSLIHTFLPCEPSFNGSSAGTPVTNVQVNIFDCGGLAIGLCISHKILDGVALGTFLKGWAKIASGTQEEAAYPNLTTASIFPANDDLWLRDSAMVMWRSMFKKGKSVTRRFVFDSSAIESLKAKATGPGVQQPTRVEAVSAFLWKCAIESSEKKWRSRRPSLLTHVVNLRKRSAQTLSENSIGNLIWIASAECKANYESGLNDLVDKVHEGISKINLEFVKKLRGDKGSTEMNKSLKQIGEFGSREGVDYFGFTSWCNLGFYEADFGWGKPIWVSGTVGSASPVFMNLIILMETGCGEGIEAWITLDEQEMEILQGDTELLAMASQDPSPLQPCKAAAEEQISYSQKVVTYDSAKEKILPGSMRAKSIQITTQYL